MLRLYRPLLREALGIQLCERLLKVKNVMPTTSEPTEKDVLYENSRVSLLDGLLDYSSVRGGLPIPYPQIRIGFVLRPR